MDVLDTIHASFADIDLEECIYLLGEFYVGASLPQSTLSQWS